MKAIPKPEIEHLKRFHLLDLMSARHLNYLREKSVLIDYAAGGVLFRPPRSRSMGYYLLSGRVEIRIPGAAARQITSESTDSYCSLEDKLPDDATALALEDCRVLQVSRVLVEQYFSWSTTGVYKAVDVSLLNQGGENEQTEWMDPLLNSPLAKNLSEGDARSFFSLFMEEQVGEGDTIIHSGESNQFFYIIKGGQARLTCANGEQRLIEAGSYFGDESLIPDAASSIQVEMTSPGVIAKLEKKYFNQFIKTSLVKRVDEKQLEYLSKEQYLLLDVRFPAEYKAGHARGSTNIPVSALQRRLHELDPTKMIFLTFESGARGELATYLLQQKGFRAFLLDDGDSPAHYKLHA